MTPPRPVLGVSAAVLRGSSVLLVKRGKPPFLGLWSLPGGVVEPGETVREAVRREVFEETGLASVVESLVDLHEVIERDQAGALMRHVVIAVFRAQAAGEPKAGDDAADARFVPLVELDRLETTPGLVRIVRRAAGEAA